MFRPSKLRTHLVQAQEAGYHPDEILEGSGVSWSEVESLQPLDLETIAGLFDYLARHTPPGFAIRAGYRSKVRNYGIVGFGTMSMPTLIAALILAGADAERSARNSGVSANNANAAMPTAPALASHHR